MKSDLTQKQIKSLLDYNPETGVFHWKEYKPGRKKSLEAGSFNTYGYKQIIINQKNYLAHRLAWVYVYGVWPNGQVDHINREKSDNRIANLREATNQQNSRNRAKQANNKSGYKGVSWSNDHKKWRARIGISRKDADSLGLKTTHKCLGFYRSKEEAYQAYLAGVEMYH